MTPAGRSTVKRWSLWAIGVALLIGVPAAVRAVPPAESEISAGDLLAQVESSRDHAFSGYVETVGTLQLPVAERFTSVGALFGERTRMRVWWRSGEQWRVDRLLTAGENDLVHEGSYTTDWDYEDAEATLSRDPEIRLPRTSDLIPPELGARVLSDVDPDELTRLPTRRVAGIAAPGLRLAPASAQTSIGHVDLWADPETGVPLRVEVFSPGESTPSFTSEFREFSARTPAADTTSFTPNADIELSYDDVLDIADAANQYAPFRPPSTVAGLAKSSTAEGAVGVYGEGLSQLIAIPLRDREADPLRTQLRITPGSALAQRGTIVTVGPLGVMLTGDDGEGGWLVAGTVTSQTLVDAAEDLLEDTVYVESFDD